MRVPTTLTGPDLRRTFLLRSHLPTRTLEVATVLRAATRVI